MQTKEKYTLLRKILRALGLPAETVDDLVQRVAELLTDQNYNGDGPRLHCL